MYNRLLSVLLESIARISVSTLQVIKWSSLESNQSIISPKISKKYQNKMCMQLKYTLIPKLHVYSSYCIREKVVMDARNMIRCRELIIIIVTALYCNVAGQNLEEENAFPLFLPFQCTTLSFQIIPSNLTLNSLLYPTRTFIISVKSDLEPFSIVDIAWYLLAFGVFVPDENDCLIFGSKKTKLNNVDI